VAYVGPAVRPGTWRREQLELVTTAAPGRPPRGADPTCRTPFSTRPDPACGAGTLPGVRSGLVTQAPTPRVACRSALRRSDLRRRHRRGDHRGRGCGPRNIVGLDHHRVGGAQPVRRGTGAKGDIRGSQGSASRSRSQWRSRTARRHPVGRRRRAGRRCATCARPRICDGSRRSAAALPTSSARGQAHRWSPLGETAAPCHVPTPWLAWRRQFCTPRQHVRPWT
jgi:hypothetical protein